MVRGRGWGGACGAVSRGAVLSKQLVREYSKGAVRVGSACPPPTTITPPPMPPPPPPAPPPLAAGRPTSATLALASTPPLPPPPLNVEPPSWPDEVEAPGRPPRAETAPRNPDEDEIASAPEMAIWAKSRRSDEAAPPSAAPPRSRWLGDDLGATSAGGRPDRNLGDGNLSAGGSRALR